MQNYAVAVVVVVAVVVLCLLLPSVEAMPIFLEVVGHVVGGRPVPGSLDGAQCILIKIRFVEPPSFMFKFEWTAEIRSGQEVSNFKLRLFSCLQFTVFLSVLLSEG